MRILKNLSKEPLFDLKQTDLFSFLKQNADEFAYTPATVLVGENEVQLNEIPREEFLLGYVDFSKGRYIMTASEEPFVRFYQIQNNIVSAHSHWFGGGVHGVYHFVPTEPVIKQVMDQMVKPHLAA